MPDHYYAKHPRKVKPLEPIEAAERFFASTGATFRHGGNMAYYAPGPDVIQLPPSEAFKDAESYAATKAHELIHWTKHEQRLNREFGRKKFGGNAYAREELVAELGAAFLCATLGITPQFDRASIDCATSSTVKAAPRRPTCTDVKHRLGASTSVR